MLYHLHVDPERSPGVRMNGVPRSPPPLLSRPRSDIGLRVVRHAHPGRTSLARGSLMFGTAVRLGLPSHTASRRRCWLASCHLHLVPLPPTRGCLRQAPQGTFTPNDSSMPRSGSQEQLPAPSSHRTGLVDRTSGSSSRSLLSRTASTGGLRPKSAPNFTCLGGWIFGFLVLRYVQQPRLVPRCV